MSLLSLDTGPLSSKVSQTFTVSCLVLFPSVLSASSDKRLYMGEIQWDVGWKASRLRDLRLMLHYGQSIWYPSWPAFRWPSLASSWRWWPYSSNHLYPIYRTAVASGTTCHISGIGFFLKNNNKKKKISSEGQTLVWGLLFFNLCWRQGMSVENCWICSLFILNWVTGLYDIFLSCLSHFVLKIQTDNLFTRTLCLRFLISCCFFSGAWLL